MSGVSRERTLWAAQLNRGFSMNTSSYVCGIASKPLIYKTIGRALEDTARAYPGNDAIVARILVTTVDKNAGPKAL